LGAISSTDHASRIHVIVHACHERNCNTRVILCGTRQLIASHRIDYNKKPGKIASVKVQKDPNVPRDDLYKSGTIHTGPGEPPNSMSKPTPKGRQKPAKAITSGKLLKANGGGKLSAAARGGQQPRPTQAARVVPQPVQNGFGAADRPKPASAMAAAMPSAVSNAASARNVPPPPPPPPPSAAPVSREPMCKALYDFNGQTSGEMSVGKGDVVLVVQKENNGKFDYLPLHHLLRRPRARYDMSLHMRIGMSHIFRGIMHLGASWSPRDVIAYAEMSISYLPLSHALLRGALMRWRLHVMRVYVSCHILRDTYPTAGMFLMLSAELSKLVSFHALGLPKRSHANMTSP
jgi:hypothetical protein